MGLSGEGHTDVVGTKDADCKVYFRLKVYSGMACGVVTYRPHLLLQGRDKDNQISTLHDD